MDNVCEYVPWHSTYFLHVFYVIKQLVGFSICIGDNSNYEVLKDILIWCWKLKKGEGKRRELKCHVCVPFLYSECNHVLHTCTSKVKMFSKWRDKCVQCEWRILRRFNGDVFLLKCKYSLYLLITLHIYRKTWYI